MFSRRQHFCEALSTRSGIRFTSKSGLVRSCRQAERRLKLTANFSTVVCSNKLLFSGYKVKQRTPTARSPSYFSLHCDKNAVMKMQHVSVNKTPCCKATTIINASGNSPIRRLILSPAQFFVRRCPRQHSCGTTIAQNLLVVDADCLFLGGVNAAFAN